jgi:CDP-glucose 4,6-dehydratase
MLNKLKETYSGKKVFLTGHTGFKGAWLLKILSILGAEVMGYALSPEDEHSLYNLIEGDKLCTSTIADLRNRTFLVQKIKEFQPDFLFHMAAQPIVRLSYEIPSETFEVNAIGTANVLDGVRELNTPCKVILITTDKVYHNNEWHYSYREIDRLGGYDPYSASKACAELIISSYTNSFFNISKYQQHKKALAVGRAGNVIGGGDWANDRLIPDIIRALMEDKVIEIRNPDAVRPWQHVLEPVFGYLLLGMRLVENPIKYSQAYNFGPQITDTFSVNEMVKLAIQSWGSGTYKVYRSPGQLHEAGMLKLDISKAEVELLWKPRLNAYKAIEFTINWYKELLNNSQGISAFTEKQIHEFLDL